MPPCWKSLHSALDTAVSRNRLAGYKKWGVRIGAGRFRLVKTEPEVVSVYRGRHSKQVTVKNVDPRALTMGLTNSVLDLALAAAKETYESTFGYSATPIPDSPGWVRVTICTD